MAKKSFLITGEFGTVGELVKFLQGMDQDKKFTVYDGPFDQDFCLEVRESSDSCWIDVSVHEWFGDYEGEEFVFTRSSTTDRIGNIPVDRFEAE